MKGCSECLTLDVKGDRVGEFLIVVYGDASEDFLVCLSAGHQDVVALHCERPVRVTKFLGHGFTLHCGLPPVHVTKWSQSCCYFYFFIFL